MNVAQLKKIASFYGRFMLSFTQVGYRLRSLAWSTPEMDFGGQRWLVTGASGGIGASIAQEASRHGATVVAAARSAAKLAALQSPGPGSIEPAVVDLSLQRDVGRLIAGLAAAGAPFDVLVNNVGVLLDDHELTAEGREMSFATNLLNHYLLTEELLRRGLLRRGGIVINMSSGGMYNVPLMIAPLNVRKPEGYNGVAAYGFHKRAQVALTGLWNERHGGSGVTFYVMHPGWADTAGVKRSLPRFRRILRPVLRDDRSGADTALWLAAVRPPVPAGEHIWFDRKARAAHAFERTRKAVDTPAAVAAFLEAELAALDGGASGRTAA